MSGQFINDGSQRITEKETLIIRDELISLLDLTKEDFNLGLYPDYYGHKNLLLPNPIKEKEDNGDIDIFFFNQPGKKSAEQFVTLLQNSKDVLKINRNDRTWTFLYSSQATGKKVQIDLHIINASNKNRENYFEYYRVPYLYFILGMVFNKLNIRLGINGISYGVEEEMGIEGEKSRVSKQFLLDKTFPNFLKGLLDFNLDTLKNIDSYEKIANFLVSQGLSEYAFFKDPSTIRGDYLKKLKGNDKLQYIINLLPEPTKSISDFKELFTKKLLEKYPFIISRKNEIIKNYLKSQEESKERRENLQKIFSVDNLSNLSILQKQQISLFTKVINEILLLQEMSSLVKEKYPTESIYLVGGAVRDILLGLGNNDWDLSGSILPEEFMSIFGGNTTEKYGTVFTTYKGLEIEYTPFRSEEGFNGRQVDTIVFSKSLKVDALRRDFTINSLYLDLQTLEVIDIYGGQGDLKNKIIKAVGSPSERFKEDYLRILRGLRLSSKLGYEIHGETYKSMIDHSSGLDSLSDERLLEEYFKGLNLKSGRGANYLIKLDKFNKDSKRLTNVIETYNSLGSQEIYSFLIYLLGGDVMKLLKVTGDNRGETFSLIIKAYTKKYPREIQSRVEGKLSEITVSDLLEILFYSKLEDLTRGQIKTYIIGLVNKGILKGTATKKDIDYLLQLYKEIIEKEHKFLYNDLKTELGIQDTNEYIQKEQIKPCDLNEVLLKKYFKKIKLHKEKEIENIFGDNIDLNESKYYQVFPDTKVDIIRQKTQTHYLLQKGGTQSISIYQITKDGDVCKESHLRQGKEVEDLIKKYNLV